MIIAVTGGTGFIGKHLIRRHLDFGDQVRYLTRDHGSQELEGAKPYIGDLNSSIEILHEFLDGADVLYHCAAELRNESQMYNTNVLGTANLLVAARGKRCRWVQLSSTGVYGKVLDGNICESSELNPNNAYEKSKTKSDMLVLDAIKHDKLFGVILRPSVVYGNDMPNRSLFQLIQMIHKNLFFFIGKTGATANYIHVENVVDALVLCGTSTAALTGSIYIVSDYCKLEELVETIAAVLDKKIPKARVPESLMRAATSFLQIIMPNFPLSPARIDALTNKVVYATNSIEKEMGFKCQISIKCGISELTRYYLTSILKPNVSDSSKK
ncbi:NAD-dependent epimerase/dehydratase family protein [Citrifermentans bremense]|uniref:NAD-dependent epimerase/dehydratase family protein n=1 Tax=Citrifermentans bremense TaxID=60035 RepID=UPI000A0599E5|nr:NAD-dependent epimerase/dehydratase family protein [Citrifermentans bremense]